MSYMAFLAGFVILGVGSLVLSHTIQTVEET